MKPSFLIIALVLFCSEMLFFSCKKSSNPSYDFSYTNANDVRDSVQFQSNAPANANLQWIFSDGVRTNEPSPVHVFYSTINTATLIINNDQNNTITKSIKLMTGAEKMTGNWHWTHGLYWDVGGFNDTSFSLPDTSFPITVINQDTINVWGSNLSFSCYPPSGYSSGYSGFSGGNILVYYMNGRIYFSNSNSIGKYNSGIGYSTP